METRDKGAPAVGAQTQVDVMDGVVPLISRTEGKLRIAAIDEDASFLEYLDELFGRRAEDTELVVATDDLAVAHRRIARTIPDIILSDMRALRGGGIDRMRAIRDRFPAIRLIILAASDDPADVRLAMNLGASGYIARGSTQGELVAAIRAVQAGKIVLAPSAFEGLIVESNGSIPVLETEELWILGLLAQGIREADVARQIAVSASTLKRQLARIVTKLGARNRVDAIVRAVRKGLI